MRRRIGRISVVLQLCLIGAGSASCGSDQEHPVGQGPAGSSGSAGATAGPGTGGLTGSGAVTGSGAAPGSGGRGGAAPSGSARVQFVLKEVH